MKKEPILINKVIGSLDVFEKACIETAKAWDKTSKSIPVKLYSQIIEKARWYRHPKSDGINKFTDNYNKMMDLMEAAAIKSANSFNCDNISLDYIKETISILKESYISGTKQK